MSSSERVLGIERKHISSFRIPDRGLLPLNTGDMTALLDCTLLEFRDRDTAEEDPSFKQIIPYIVFATPARKLFTYRRTPKGGESRLHGRRSIGIGGHINTDDFGADNPSPLVTYTRGLHREIAEELELEPWRIYESEVVGLLNDDTDKVGSVHLGVVHLIMLCEPKLALSKAEDHVDDGFYHKYELLSDLDSFESWSGILLRSAFRGW
jgi:predicted NUDIX family phosphoesterase